MKRFDLLPEPFRTKLALYAFIARVRAIGGGTWSQARDDWDRQGEDIRQSWYNAAAAVFDEASALRLVETTPGNESLRDEVVNRDGVLSLLASGKQACLQDLTNPPRDPCGECTACAIWKRMQPAALPAAISIHVPEGRSLEVELGGGLTMTLARKP